MIREFRALGGAHAKASALALTAHARDEDRRRALAAGFQAHMAKPFDAHELLHVAADLISNARRPQA
jgi:CheY-like chemotaxis protein